MKTKSIILITASITIFAACRATKNNTTTTPTLANTTPTQQNNFEATKYTHGVYPPGNQELLAIQPQFPNVTLATLQQGFTIYSVGKCINCHGAKNIYKHNQTQWQEIIDDMAQRAKISAIEKDAVYKYVLAIKAAQPK